MPLQPHHNNNKNKNNNNNKDVASSGKFESWPPPEIMGTQNRSLPDVTSMIMKKLQAHTRAKTTKQDKATKAKNTKQDKAKVLKRP